MKDFEIVEATVEDLKEVLLSSLARYTKSDKVPVDIMYTVLGIFIGQAIETIARCESMDKAQLDKRATEFCKTVEKGVHMFGRGMVKQ